jgi:hypothetical protein
MRNLEGAPLRSNDRPGDEADSAANQTIKVTVRMRRCVARHLSSHARARGLSHGTYLSALIEGAPALPLAIDHREAVAALGVSTDQLALVAADLQDFARLVRQGMAPSAEQFGDTVAMLAGDVRMHLGLAARLMAELKPTAAPRRGAGKRLDSQGAHL